jgi:hypothetical protein
LEINPNKIFLLEKKSEGMGGGWTDLIWYNFVLPLPNCPQSITLLYHLFGKNLFFLLNNLDRETNRYIGRGEITDLKI